MALRPGRPRKTPSCRAVAPTTPNTTTEASTPRVAACATIERVSVWGRMCRTHTSSVAASSAIAAERVVSCKLQPIRFWYAPGRGNAPSGRVSPPMRSRDIAEWVALAIAAVLLVVGGRAFARAHMSPPPPVRVEVPAPPPPDNPSVWVQGNAQAHALTIASGWACWTEGDGAVRMASPSGTTNDPKVTTFVHAFASAGPVLTCVAPDGGASNEPCAPEACWFSTRAALQCGSPAGAIVDVAQAANSVVKMASDERGIVWTQFDGVVGEVARGRDERGQRGQGQARVRTLATLHDPVDVVLDGDDAYVVELDPLRIVRLSRTTGASRTLFERPAPRVGGESAVSHLGTVLQDHEALYLDTYDSRDRMTEVLRIAKSDGAVTPLYRGFAHVAITALHGAMLYGVVPSSHGELDLQDASVFTLPTGGGALRHVRTPATETRAEGDLVIGWGGSVAVADGSLFYTHGPRNPVGAPGPIWRLRL
jgi:hypothetical protein